MSSSPQRGWTRHATPPGTEGRATTRVQRLRDAVGVRSRGCRRWMSYRRSSVPRETAILVVATLSRTQIKYNNASSHREKRCVPFGIAILLDSVTLIF